MRAALLLVLLAILCGAASAQRIPPTPFARAELEVAPGLRGYQATSPTAGARVPAEAIDAGKMVLGGVLAGAGGLVAGALIGNRFEGSPARTAS
jgi:hypothetical protein